MGHVPAIALAVLMSAAMAAGVRPSAPASPVAVVRAFYAYHFAHHMGFTEASVRAKAAWLAPTLVDLCRAYFSKAVSPAEVPDIDGDPFTDSQDYPKSFRVGRSRSSKMATQVAVILAWPHRQRTISVQLMQQHGSWHITDIVYDDSRSFRGLLSSGR